MRLTQKTRRGDGSLGGFVMIAMKKHKVPTRTGYTGDHPIFEPLLNLVNTQLSLALDAHVQFAEQGGSRCRGMTPR